MGLNLKIVSLCFFCRFRESEWESRKRRPGLKQEIIDQLTEGRRVLSQYFTILIIIPMDTIIIG